MTNPPSPTQQTPFYQSKKAQWIASLLLVFFAFLLLNFLTPLMADDYNYRFSFATWQRTKSVGDVFTSMQAHYYNSNGRVVTHFFASLMLLLGMTVFNVCNTLVSIALLLGLCRFSSKRKASPFLFLTFAAVLFVLLPRYAQTMLWLTGACNYLWGTTFILWMLMPFRDALMQQPSKWPVWKQALFLLGCPLMGAVSENFSPAAIVFMGLCLVYLLLKKQKPAPFLWASIPLAIAGFLFMILSPASQSRNAGSFPADASFLGRYLQPFANALQMFLENAAWPTILFLFFLCVAVHRRMDSGRIACAVCAFVCGFLANLAMTATGLYPHRAMTGCLVMLLVACGILLVPLQKSSLRPALRALQCALILAAAVQLLYSTPLTFDRYREAASREQFVIAQRDARNMHVQTTNIKGYTKYDVFYDMIDLTYDPAYFSNFVFARYYDIETVTINELR